MMAKPDNLRPCLSLLSHLYQPGKGFLLSVDRNPLLHLLLKKTFYRQFRIGENEAEVLSTIQRFRNMDFSGIILTCCPEGSRSAGLRYKYLPELTMYGHWRDVTNGLGTVIEYVNGKETVVEHKKIEHIFKTFRDRESVASARDAFERMMTRLEGSS